MYEYLLKIKLLNFINKYTILNENQFKSNNIIQQKMLLRNSIL